MDLILNLSTPPGENCAPLDCATNRASRSGYQIAFVAFKDGKPSADPVPFMTGLVPDPKGSLVYGRPVGVTTPPDGSLLVSDDGIGVIYRITYAP